MFILFGLMLLATPLLWCYHRFGSLDEEALAQFFHGLKLDDLLRLRPLLLIGWVMLLYGCLRLFLPGVK